MDIIEQYTTLPNTLTVEEKLDVIMPTVLREEQLDAPVYHKFFPGIYMRELHMKAGTFAVGHVHKVPYTNICLKGKIRILQDDGSSVEVSAPYMFEGKEGVRKVAVVLEDTVWLNIFVTDETDVNVLENILFDLDASPWLQEYNNSIREERYMMHEQDRQDFILVCAQLGYTPEQVREMAESLDDLIDFPQGSQVVEVGNSDIEGKGLFASANITKGSVICTSRLGGKRTPAGRYTNHSVDPNARAIPQPNGDIVFVALKDIHGRKGGMRGDEITVDYYETYLISRIGEDE